MSKKDLHNLGSEQIEDFLLKNDCLPGATHGDDKIYYYRHNFNIGISVRINTKVKKSGYPKGTLLNMIKWLNKASAGRVSKTTWIEWFSK